MMRLWMRLKRKKFKLFVHSFFQFRLRLYVDDYEYNAEDDDDDELNECVSAQLKNAPE